jgi:ribosomal protein L20
MIISCPSAVSKKQNDESGFFVRVSDADIKLERKLESDIVIPNYDKLFI